MNGLLASQILMDGLIISLCMMVIIFTGMTLNPRVMLTDYPPEVQAQVPPLTAAEKNQQRLLGVFFIGCAFIGLFYSDWRLVNRAGEVSFLPLFLNTYLVFLIMNLFDLLVIDYLVLIVLKPKFLFIENAEEFAQYNTFTHHFKGFLKGLLIGVVLSLIIATVSSLIFPLLLH